MRNQTRIVGKDWYIYDGQATAIAGQANATDTINIQANSDFRLYQLSYIAFINNALVTDSTRILPLVTVQLTDTGSGQQLFSDQLPIPLMFGTGERPYVLPEPRIFRANTTLTINFNNFSAATTYDIYLAFMGKKVYAGTP